MNFQYAYEKFYGYLCKNINYFFQNPKRTEIQNQLTVFLDASSGFYALLLQDLCHVFKINLPCRVRASKLSLLRGKFCFIICCCLVYFLDIIHLFHITNVIVERFIAPPRSDGEKVNVVEWTCYIWENNYPAIECVTLKTKIYENNVSKYLVCSSLAS